VRNKKSSLIFFKRDCVALVGRFLRSLFLEVIHAVALTSDPAERLVKKLSKALCASLISPELSADPISESRLVNELLSELVDVLLVELVLSLESSKLVSES